MLLGGLSCLRPAHVDAQSSSRWFPDVRPFPSLVAAPREVLFRGSFVFAKRPDLDGFGGRNLEAEVVIGHRLPLLRLDDGSRDGRAVTLEFEVGTFSRFFMEAATKDLINSDFRVGLPLSVREGSWQGRITIRHISSHLGDDYLARFGGVVRQTSKDGFEGIVARTFGGAGRMYAGGDYNFHVNEDMSRYTLRSGLEWDPEPGGEHDTIWPFFAADVDLPSLSDRAGGTLVGGMGFRLNGRAVRLEARGHFGSTPLGQLRETEETFFGLGLRLAL